MTTFFAPVEGESIRSDSSGPDVGGFVNGRWQPSSRSRRSSLHDIHLRPSPAPEEPPQPVEVPQSYAAPYQYAPQQAAADFTQGDNAMAGNNHGGTLDDLQDFDPYDPAQM